MKKSCMNFLDTMTRGYARYAGSIYAVCSTVVIKLPDYFTPRLDMKYMSDKFLPTMVDEDLGSPEHLIDVNIELWHDALRKQKPVAVFPGTETRFSYNTKYIKLFNWQTDAVFKYDRKGGLMYVFEKRLGYQYFIGLICPIKKKEVKNEEDNK